MRAFIIGNGPSLKEQPLDSLLNETTFAMNRINLLYDFTTWRPTYYFAFDFTGPDMLNDMAVNVEVAKHSFIRADRANELELLRHKTFEYPSRITYIWHCREHLGLEYDESDPVHFGRLPKDWHLPQLCAFGSTLNVAMQVAVVMGYNPLYLLGCDLGFKNFEAGEPDPNHFDSSYIGYDDFAWDGRDATLRYMHKMIKFATSSRGIEVINLTPRDILNDIYTHKNLMEVL
jgi:hypothetical protein